MGNKAHDRQAQHTVMMNVGKLKKWSLLLLVCGVVGAILLVGAVRLVTHFNSSDQYCSSIDPTECTISVQINNDTNATVDIKQCRDDSVPCQIFAATAKLSPGATRRANGSTDQTPEVWMVLNARGEVIGCLNLEFTKYQPSPVSVPISKMLSCRAVGDSVEAFKKQYHVF